MTDDHFVLSLSFVMIKFNLCIFYAASLLLYEEGFVMVMKILVLQLKQIRLLA